MLTSDKAKACFDEGKWINVGVGKCMDEPEPEMWQNYSIKADFLSGGALCNMTGGIADDRNRMCRSTRNWWHYTYYDSLCRDHGGDFVWGDYNYETRLQEDSMCIFTHRGAVKLCEMKDREFDWVKMRCLDAFQSCEKQKRTYDHSIRKCLEPGELSRDQKNQKCTWDCPPNECGVFSWSNATCVPHSETCESRGGRWDWEAGSVGSGSSPSASSFGGRLLFGSSFGAAPSASHQEHHLCTEPSEICETEKNGQWDASIYKCIGRDEMLTSDKAHFCYSAQGQWDSISMTCDHGMKPDVWCTFTAGIWTGQSCYYPSEDSGSVAEGGGSSHDSDSGNDEKSPAPFPEDTEGGGGYSEGSDGDGYSDKEDTPRFDCLSGEQRTREMEEWCCTFENQGCKDDFDDIKPPDWMVQFEACLESGKSPVECDTPANETVAEKAEREKKERKAREDMEAKTQELMKAAEEKQKRDQKAAEEKEKSDKNAAEETEKKALAAANTDAEREQARKEAQAAKDKVEKDAQEEKRRIAKEAAAAKAAAAANQLEEKIKMEEKASMAKREEHKKKNDAAEQARVEAKKEEEQKAEDKKKRLLDEVETKMQERIRNGAMNEEQAEKAAQALREQATEEAKKALEKAERDAEAEKVRIAEEATKAEKEREEKKFNDLFSNFKNLTGGAGPEANGDTSGASPTEEDEAAAYDATEAQIEEFKKSIKDTLCKKQKCSEIETDLEFAEQMGSIAEEATMAKLESCSKSQDECDADAKKEAEKKVGKMTDLEYQEKKSKAVLSSFQEDNAYKQTLADLENKAKEAAEKKRQAILDAENAKKSALENAETPEEIENAKKAAADKRKQAEAKAAEEEEKLARKASVEIEEQLQEKLKSMGYADETTNVVPARKINQFKAQIETEAAASAADAAETPDEKRNAILNALKNSGKILSSDRDTSMKQVAEVQMRATASKVSKFFSAGACKDVSTLGEKTMAECNDAAKESAEKTLGRPIRPTEFTKLREDSAVAAAASLRDDCPPDQDGCAEAAIEKLKSITGDAKITQTKVEKYIRSGTQRSAATDMESCLAKEKPVKECRAELSASVARSLGRTSKSVPVEEVQEIVRSGARSSAYQKLVACREAAGDDAAKKSACSSREEVNKAYEDATGLAFDKTAQVKLERETKTFAFAEVAKASRTNGIFDRNKLIEELKISTGIDLTSKEYQFQSLKESASAAHVGEMARACADAGETEKCDIESESLTSEAGDGKDYKARRAGAQSVFTQRLESCMDAGNADPRKCAESDDVKQTSSVLNGQEQFDRVARAAASEMTTKKHLDCMAVDDADKEECLKDSKNLFDTLTKKDTKDGKQIETFEGAQTRQAMAAARRIQQCDSSEASQCSEEMKKEISNMNYEEHNSEVVALNTAKSAAAEVWADASKNGKSEKEADSAAETEFSKFAPKGLLNKDRVATLGKTMRDGGATQMTKSDKEVTTLFTLPSKAKNGCDNVADKIETTRRLVVAAADDVNPKGAASFKTDVKKFATEDKSSCEVVFKTQVAKGNVAATSKEIYDRFQRTGGNRRRLGGTDTGVQLSSSATEEEVLFGDEPEETKWSDDTSASSSGSSLSSDDGYGDDDAFFLNSSGRYLEANLPSMLAAILLVVGAGVYC